MTALLVRLFVKDSENTGDPHVRASYGALAGVVGIVCNVLLGGAKVLIGLLLGAMSVITDGINNISDAASSVIGLVGVHLSEKPADEDHPFGHGRYEYIAALIVAFLILEVAVTCFKSSFAKITEPEELSFSLISVIVLLLSILVKIWLSIFNRRLGRKVNSTVMEATSKDAIGDVFVTSATVVSLLVIRLWGVNIDGYIGCGVAIMVFIAGINVARDTIEPLLGEAAPAELCKDIKHFVEKYDGIEGTHDLIVHSYGPSHRMASIHAEVRNDIDIEFAHEMIDRIERDMMREMNIYVVIHMDPIDVSEDVLAKRDIVASIVREIEPKATIHDFRMVNGVNRINLIFDLVAPFEYKHEKQTELVNEVSRLVTQYDRRFCCVITVENSFVKEE